MIIIDAFPQNSPEWMQARLGNPGASNFHRIITSKGARSKSRDSYLKDLAGEAITGRPVSTHSSWKMEQGLLNEEESRSLYEFVYNVKIIQVALCYPDEQKKYHCSPDGLMPELRKGFETKDATETPRIQIERLESGRIESQHWIQCQGSLLVTGYDAWVYQSYCRGMRPLTIEVYPDAPFLKKLEEGLEAFCLELALLIKRLKED